MKQGTISALETLAQNWYNNNDYGTSLRWRTLPAPRKAGKEPLQPIGGTLCVASATEEQHTVRALGLLPVLSSGSRLKEFCFVLLFFFCLNYFSACFSQTFCRNSAVLGVPTVPSASHEAALWVELHLRLPCLLQQLQAVALLQHDGVGFCNETSPGG